MVRVDRMSERDDSEWVGEGRGWQREFVWKIVGVSKSGREGEKNSEEVWEREWVKEGGKLED